MARGGSSTVGAAGWSRLAMDSSERHRHDRVRCPVDGMDVDEDRSFRPNLLAVCDRCAGMSQQRGYRRAPAPKVGSPTPSGITNVSGRASLSSVQVDTCQIAPASPPCASHICGQADASYL